MGCAACKQRDSDPTTLRRDAILEGAPTPTATIGPPPGKIVVRKTGKLYDNRNLVPTYSTHSKNRGEVLIINNVMFKDEAYRHGAKKDDKNLKNLFEQMGFKVTIERDLKTSDMERKVQKFSQKNSLRSADMTIVVIMSHGTRNETVGDTEVFGLDDNGVLAEDLMAHFDEKVCKSMADKPKIFIFQCCRGDNEFFIESDAARRALSLNNALIAYSTLPGFVSHRHPQHGTWYISTLCEVFSQHAHECHIEDLLKMVDQRLSTRHSNVRQITHYECRGFKRCYLHPI